MRFRDIISLLPKESQEEARHWKRNTLRLTWLGFAVSGLLGFFIGLAVGDPNLK